MRSHVAKVFVLMCSISIGSFVSGCDGRTHIKGVVLDSNDIPIGHAEVRLTTGKLNQEVKSSDSGVFKIGLTHSPWNPELTLSVTKPGFKPFEKHFHAREHLESIIASLEPISAGQDASTPPFSVSIVSGRRDGITMAKHGAREFYVVLTNVTNGPRPVWEYWNSWGFQTVSFELTTADGKQFVLSKKDKDFDVNFPSFFIVEPGEHQVFAIGLDESWEAQPTLPTKAEMPITLRAVYEVASSREASKYNVWTGRIESHSYKLSLLQY